MDSNQMELLIRLEDHLSEYNLISRELEIIRFWIRDFSYDEIATALGLSNETVRKHIDNANIKMGAHSKTGLIVLLGNKLFNTHSTK